MFSKAFFRENGESPPLLWGKAIARLTDAQISEGLANLGNDGLSFPPNLSQFVAACKRQKPIAPWRSLPAPPEDPMEVDRKWREDMRRLGYDSDGKRLASE